VNRPGREGNGFRDLLGTWGSLARDELVEMLSA